MRKRYDITKFYGKVTDAIKKNEAETVFPAHFYKSFFAGKSTYFQKEEIESNRFDDLWIKTIESYFPSLDRITINLRSALKYQSEIIPIEKAKKISKDSVIHLMSHSNFIKELTDDGVVPRQLLTHLPEIEYGIYENRFIMTLIGRLRDFINKRIKLMQEKIKAYKHIHLNISTQMKFEESDFEMAVDIKQIQEVERRKVDEHNEQSLERAEKLLRLITRLHNSQFMQTLRKFKPVASPIIKTQVILKNPDFRNAYTLWMYLDRNNELGYKHTLKRTNKQFTKSYTKHLNQSMLMLFTTLLANDKSGATDSSIDGRPTYRERAAKVIKKLPMEIDIEPTMYEFEDTSINEYYLERNKQILKKQYENLIEEGSDNKVALRKALADSINITNALYQSFFEINADEDIFYSLIKEKDISAMHQEAYDKYIIACTIREEKEKDFRMAIALEKKWQKEIIKSYQLLMQAETAETEKNTSDILDDLKKRYNEKLDIAKEEDFREKQELMRQHKAESSLLRKKLNQEYRENKKKVTEENKKRLITERKRIREQAQLAQTKEEKQHKATIERLKKEHAQKMENLIAQAKEKYNKQKEELAQKYTDSIEKQKESIKQQAETRKLNYSKSQTLHKESMQKRQQVRKENLQQENQEKLINYEKNLKETEEIKIAEYKQKHLE